MNLGTVSYLPPRGKLNCEAFLTNLGAWQSRYPLHFYSDDLSHGVTLITNPEVIKNPKLWFAVNNLVFLFGLKKAIDSGLDYFLYLESDVRVRGHYWDQVIFDDCFRESRTPLLYGTPVIFNLSQNGAAPLMNGLNMAYRFMAMTGCPPAVHGSWPGAKFEFCLFPNGALGVYHVPTLARMFQGFENDIGRAAMNITAWDCEIGQRFWKAYGPDLFEHFQFATRCFSGYGDELTTIEQRTELLQSGKVSACHQFKTGQTFTE